MVQSLRGENLEERVARLNALRGRVSQQQAADYQNRLDMSWIYHDSALEGVVYTMEELRAAIHDQVVSDSSLIPVYDEIRHHKAAIDAIRELASKKRFSITLDVIKDLYAQIAPEDIEGKGPAKYRKDVPVHRAYFHDIAPPEKISYRMRQLVQWINSNDTKRQTHPVRRAAKAHYQLLHIYPFPRYSGKVARLLMNLILMHNGYPAAIIHATERQRYYEALKTSDDAAAGIVQEALVASVETGIRFFEAALGERSSAESA